MALLDTQFKTQTIKDDQEIVVILLFHAFNGIEKINKSAEMTRVNQTAFSFFEERLRAAEQRG